MEKVTNRTNSDSHDKMKGFGDTLSKAARDQIEPLQEKANEATARFAEVATEARKKFLEKSRVASKAVNQRVHTQPWAYIGGIAAVSLGVGYILGCRSK